MGKRKKNFLDNLVDVGKNLFPLGSRIFGGDDTEEASQQQQDKYLQMQQDYLNQIEPNRAARMEALGKSLSLFQPAGDALNQMYGTNYDFGSLLSNDPMTAAEDKIKAQNWEDFKRQVAWSGATEAEKQRNEQGQPVDWGGLEEGLREYQKNKGK